MKTITIHFRIDSLERTLSKGIEKGELFSNDVWRRDLMYWGKNLIQHYINPQGV